jgi:hypothetical protein
VTLSVRAKIGFGLAVLIGLIGYLVIVDYGINAGRIHHGVNVRGIDVGGLTKFEAEDILEVEGEKLLERPVILTREGMSCNFLPTEMGWDPRPSATAAAAYRVGRGESWIAALGSRVKAWVAGARIDWNDVLDRNAVSRLIDDCEVQAQGLGFEIRRPRLRELIREGIKAWPRTPVTIPVFGRA